MLPWRAGLLLIALLFWAAPLRAESERGSIRNNANGVLAVLGLSIVPSETASAITIKTDGEDDAHFRAIQLGGAFTVSDELPLYLEGFVGVARYDPSFIFDEDEELSKVDARWDSLAGTLGVGWDFALTDELVIRPIGNLSLGVVESDATFAGDGLEAVSQAEAEFLDDGELRAYGYGGSLMLDWERYREDYLIDAELRYTHITIRTFDSSSNAVQGSSDAITLGFWGRLRVPTDINAFGRPLRALGEVAASRLIGDQSDVLRTDNLFQIGGGVEFDFGAKESFPITRGRVVGRYLFGGGATGVSLGLAVSF